MLLLALAIACPLLGIFYALISLYEAFTTGRVTFRAHLRPYPRLSARNP